MHDSWRDTTWGEEVTLNYGKAIRGYQDTIGPYRVYGSNGAVGWHTEMLASGPGVILGRKGAYRGVRYSSDPFFVIDTAYYLTPKAEMNMRWLYYAVIHHRLGEIDDGSPIPSTTRAAVYVRPLKIPPLCEQEQIADVLGSLDDKIELNRRMNETLEAMAQTIFRDWFVDFGPTRRKLDGATDPVIIMGGLLQDAERAQAIADLFPATLGDDGLPEGWSFKPLDESLVLQRGFDLPKSSRTDGLYPVIAASGPSGTHSKFKVVAPGVCTGRSGVLGNVFYVQQDFWPLNTSLWIKAYPNATPLYAYFLLKEIDLLALNAGSAVPTLNRNHVHNRPTVTPPMAAVSAYTGIAEMLMVKSDQAAKECKTLAATRDLLLPKLMSGEIRLSEAVGAAA
jgi:type I restriction enzyme, S subunit